MKYLLLHLLSISLPFVTISEPCLSKTNKSPKSYCSKKDIRSIMQNKQNNKGILPNWIMVGPGKSGTTAIYDDLTTGHPQISDSVLCKEIHFFDNDNYFSSCLNKQRRNNNLLAKRVKGAIIQSSDVSISSNTSPEVKNQLWMDESFYRGNFPLKCDKIQLAGYATPGYFSQPQVPPRIAFFMPVTLKLMFFFRDPVYRFISRFIGNLEHQKSSTGLQKTCETYIHDAEFANRACEIQYTKNSVVGNKRVSGGGNINVISSSYNTNQYEEDNYKISNKTDILYKNKNDMKFMNEIICPKRVDNVCLYDAYRDRQEDDDKFEVDYKISKNNKVLSHFQKQSNNKVNVLSVSVPSPDIPASNAVSRGAYIVILQEIWGKYFDLTGKDGRVLIMPSEFFETSTSSSTSSSTTQLSHHSLQHIAKFLGLNKWEDIDLMNRATAKRHVGSSHSKHYKEAVKQLLQLDRSENFEQNLSKLTGWALDFSKKLKTIDWYCNYEHLKYLHQFYKPYNIALKKLMLINYHHHHHQLINKESRSAKSPQPHEQLEDNQWPDWLSGYKQLESSIGHYL